MATNSSSFDTEGVTELIAVYCKAYHWLSMHHRLVDGRRSSMCEEDQYRRMFEYCSLGGVVHNQPVGCSSVHNGFQLGAWAQL